MTAPDWYCSAMLRDTKEKSRRLDGYFSTVLVCLIFFKVQKSLSFGLFQNRCKGTAFRQSVQGEKYVVQHLFVIFGFKKC